MKIDQVLVHYLLKAKQLSLQGIGNFYLDVTIPDNADPDKPIIIPADAIKFTYNPKATEDSDLVDFIVLQTKKIKPLASSDLDSFLSLGRQFLNIGKPFNLPGIGTLEKLNSGELVFIGGQHIAPRMEPQRVKIEDAGAEEHEENMFNDYQKERKENNGKKAFIFLVVLAILGLMVWAAIHYVFKEGDSGVTTTDHVAPVDDSARIKDSLKIYAPVIDSAAIKNPSDSFTFKIVVNEFTNKQAALTRLNNLKSYNRKVIMYTADSIIYKIAEPFMRALSDTSKVLDSLNRYYPKANTRVEF